MITVLRPGMMTTVQDMGRWGWQHLGVPPGGPMDPLSFRLSNRLVGNDDWAPALEITLLGPALQFERDAVIAIAGADLGASVDLDHATPVSAGTVLRFAGKRTMTRAYLAVAGGLDVPSVLGSRAACLSARLPGLAGRLLKAGDRLPVGAAPRRPTEPVTVSGRPHPMNTADPVLRFLWGPDRDSFTDEAAETFVRARFRLATQSNRMGYRLEGQRVSLSGGGQLLSEGSPVGSIQIPPSGEPVVLMADRQTTGGYARIGTVITADLAVAGQLGPGDPVRFQPCDRAEALEALREQESWLAGIGGGR